MQYFQQSTMSLSKEEFSSNDGSGMLPLLSGEQEYEEEHHAFTRRKPKFPVWPFIVHLIIFSAYTIAFLAYSKSVQGENCHKSLIYSPVREAVKWERVTSENELEEKNPYKGPPRPELDDAWHDLLKHSSIRVSEEDLRKINRTSIKLADGSGKYMAEINAYHHLHCLKLIRRVIYTDYYGQPEEEMVWTHLEHCMEDLRQTIMCKADFSLLTYDWIPNYRKPWPNFKMDHECVDWKAFDDWAGERSFSLFDQKSLVHPELGLAFPRINGTIDFHGGPLPKTPDGNVEEKEETREGHGTEGATQHKGHDPTEIHAGHGVA